MYFFAFQVVFDLHVFHKRPPHGRTFTMSSQRNKRWNKSEDALAKRKRPKYSASEDEDSKGAGSSVGRWQAKQTTKIPQTHVKTSSNIYNRSTNGMEAPAEVSHSQF